MVFIEILKLSRQLIGYLDLYPSLDPIARMDTRMRPWN
jgi:hypothetical protein